MSVGRIWAVAGLALLVSGCASGMHSHRMAQTPPPPPPPSTVPTGSAVAGATTAQAAPAHTGGIGHRQYFDQRRKRYYFYDPARRAYFWEDGTPKT